MTSMNRPVEGTVNATSMLTDLFDAYQSNLACTGNSPGRNDIILCPLCLRKIFRNEIVSGRVRLEHIIPQHAASAKSQRTRSTRISVKNVRSGLTITCEACNKKKGSELDWRMRGLIGPGKRTKNQYVRRMGVAILIYAYLLAFAVYGYEYVLAPALDEVREQFQDTDEYRTSLLEHSCVCLPETTPIVCNEYGYPCFFGGMRGGAPWRFTSGDSERCCHLQAMSGHGWRYRDRSSTLSGDDTSSVPWQEGPQTPTGSSLSHLHGHPHHRRIS